MLTDVRSDETTAAVPRLSLVATDELLPPTRLLYEPMVSFVAAGAKRTVASAQSWSVPAGRMLLNTVQLPVTAVFEQVPYRSAVLALDKQILTELLLELGPTAPPPAVEPAWRVTTDMPAELIDAVTRLVRLLDTPDDIGVLAPRVESEILYRLLTGPLGPALRQTAAAAGTRIRAVITWLGDRFAEPVSIDQIAAEAGDPAPPLQCCHRFRTSAACAPTPCRTPRSPHRTDRGDQRTPRTPPRIRHRVPQADNQGPQRDRLPCACRWTAPGGSASSSGRLRSTRSSAG